MNVTDRVSVRTVLSVLSAAAFLAAFVQRAEAVQFSAVQTLQGGVGQATALAFGPEDPDPGSSSDGCIYAVDGNGKVTRICFDANKTVTSTIPFDINPSGGTNKTLGITFDPTLPNGEYHMYLSVAYSNGAPFNGRIVRAVSTDGGASYTFDESFITGLARSSFDHQTNGLAFGPDGCLYVAQGNNSNAGYDQDFAESRLSSAVLRACFKDVGGDVDPLFDGNCGNGNSQEACDVEVYASGLRNPYDLVWHSNGSLYCTDNDTGGGFRDNCATNANTFGCPCQDVANEEGDEINRIEQGKYYGSPNPYLAIPTGLQCQGGTSGGDACSPVGSACPGGGICADLSALCTDGVCGDTVQCYYVDQNENNIPPGGDPNDLYRAPIMPQTGLIDGVIEYRAPLEGLFLGSFCSDFDGDLIVTGAGGALRRTELSPDGLTGTMIGAGGLNGIAGLDVVAGPDGTIYAANLGGGSVTYIEPIAQPNDQAADYFVACSPGELCTGGACQPAVAGCANPPAGDLDCDGLADTQDPCPIDTLNRCFGAPPACLGGDCTLGQPVRLDIGASAPQTDCAGDTWHADSGNGNNTSGNVTVTQNPIIDAFGCTSTATETLVQTYKFGTDIADPQSLPNGGLIRSYQVPDGVYVVNLLFAEVYQPVCNQGGGGRTSDVYVEGVQVYGGAGVADGVDPYLLSLNQNGAPDACGGLVVRSVVAAVSDGAIDIIVQEDGPGGDADFNAGVQAIEIIGTAPSCSSDAECDDGNDCTADSCFVGQCTNVDEPNGTTCDDGNPSTFNDTCTAGVCSGITDDPDNDGMSGPNDPCPADALNACFGPVAVDGTTGFDIRINTGPACTTAFTDCRGESWGTDFGALVNQNSSTCNLGGGCPVDATGVFGCTDVGSENMFKCEHWDPAAAPELQYSFDVPDGNYLVNLLFMNAYTGTATVGTRVFDILVEGGLIYDDFDQVDAAGGSGIPVVRAVEIHVGDGNGLQIEFLHVTENPAIKGIEVLLGGTCTIDQDCDDSNPCTDDLCTSGGVCSNPPNAASCDDGASCTSNDTCSLGVCVGTDTCPAGQACDVPAGICDASGVDNDGDTFSPPADCDDGDANVFPGAPEICDGKDNDCGGQIDEGNPGSGGSCSTGQPGICAAGTEQCQGGAIVCVPDNSPTAEICNFVDDDCDGSTDEGNPGGGGQCGTTDVGECAFGTEQCLSGSLQCVGEVGPSAETCNGLDDDCDGAVDQGNPGGGASCSGGGLGVCGDGTEQCQGGAIVCVADNSPSAELCDGLDNDCDGTTDEGNPEGGGACSSGVPGICDAGTEICQGGSLNCVPNNAPGTETCNGLDDDCNGSTDEGNPGGGAPCTTGLPGICTDGTITCTGGALDCEPVATAQPELCNGVDDNCDGVIDEGNPEGGAVCDTGGSGICAAGTDTCQGGTVSCVADQAATAEICASGQDEDCDGEVDETADCQLCLAENTVELNVQTKRNKIKLLSTPNRDKVVAKGTLFLSQAGDLTADSDEVILRVSDEAGSFYEGTVPAGSFVAASNGRKFTYKDRTKPFENDGLRIGKFATKSDLVTTKYRFKAQELELPAFTGTQSTTTVKVGDTCYVDIADTCETSSSGTTVKCR